MNMCVPAEPSSRSHLRKIMKTFRRQHVPVAKVLVSVRTMYANLSSSTATAVTLTSSKHHGYEWRLDVNMGSRVSAPGPSWQDSLSTRLAGYWRHKQSVGCMYMKIGSLKSDRAAHAFISSRGALEPRFVCQQENRLWNLRCHEPHMPNVQAAFLPKHGSQTLDGNRERFLGTSQPMAVMQGATSVYIIQHHATPFLACNLTTYSRWKGRRVTVAT